MRNPVTMLALRVAPLVLAAGCGGQLEAEWSSTGEARGRLTITGSSTLAPLVGDVARRFEAMHPGTRIDVHTGGSERGLADVRRGQADVAMVSRALDEDGPGLCAVTIARDGVGLIVHSANAVEQLTRAQVVAIYRGEVRNWSELGCAPLPIATVHKAEGRATLAVFLRHFGLASREVRPTLVVGENQEGIKIVAGDPGAIGYVSIGAAEVEIALGAPIRLLPMEGVPATIPSVSSGRFPIVRPLLLVTREAPGDLASAFLELARSDAVADLVQEHAYAAPLDR